MTDDGRMLDTTRPAVLTIPLQDGAAAVAGYLDGPDSAWPAGAFDRFEQAGIVNLRGSVLADDAAEWFDDEGGNAPTAEICDAARRRLGRGLWSWHYVNGDNSGLAEAQLEYQRRGIIFPEPPENFPAPGVYWWAVEWTGTPHRNPQSIATQWTNGNLFDSSSIHPNVTAAPPAPAEKADDDMPFIIEDGNGQWITNGVERVAITRPADAEAIIAASGAKTAKVQTDMLERIPDVTVYPRAASVLMDTPPASPTSSPAPDPTPAP